MSELSEQDSSFKKSDTLTSLGSAMNTEEFIFSKKEPDQKPSLERKNKITESLSISTEKEPDKKTSLEELKKITEFVSVTSATSVTSTLQKKFARKRPKIITITPTKQAIITQDDKISPKKKRRIIDTSSDEDGSRDVATMDTFNIEESSDVEIFESTNNSKRKNLDVKEPVNIRDFQARHLFTSRLSTLGQTKMLRDFVSLCFGLNTQEVTPGLIISDKNEDDLINYILSIKDIKVKRKDIKEIDNDRRMSILDTKLLYIVIPHRSYNLLLTIGDMLRISNDEMGGWMSGQILILLQDAFNLYIGCNILLEKPYPRYIFANGYAMDALLKLAQVGNNIRNFIDIEDEDFEEEFKLHIKAKSLKTMFGNLIQKYVDAGEDLDYIYSYLNVSTQHFVALVIDMKNKTVITIDPYQHIASKEFVVARKWIAKIFSALDFLVKEIKDEDNKLYLGSIDMKFEEFTSIEKETLEYTIRSKNVMFYHYDFFSEHEQSKLLRKQFKLPKQTDGKNCGLYALWYGIIHMYKYREVASFDPKRFRKQVLFFIVGLDFFYTKHMDNRFTFAKNASLIDVMRKHGNDELKTIVEGIVSKNQAPVNNKIANEHELKDEDLNLPIFQIPSMKEWCKKLAHQFTIKNHFFNKELLRSIVNSDESEEIFGEPLRELSLTNYADIKLVLYWNFHTKTNIIKTLYDAVKERFVDDADSPGINHILKKKGTYALTLQIKDAYIDEPKIVSYSVFSALYNQKTVNNKPPTLNCVTVDYFGTTAQESKYVLPSYQHQVLSGKGIGRFLLNMTQLVCFVLSNKKSYPILLKCNDDYKSFYEEVGFVRPSRQNNPFLSKEVQNHYKNIPNLANNLNSYSLGENVIIQHKKKSFINHVLHEYNDLMDQGFIDKKLVKKIHNIFISKTFIGLLEKCNVARNNDDFVIPIGKIILHFYKEYKPAEIKLQQGLYEMIMETLVWQLEIETFKSKSKKKPVCNVDLLCDRCGRYLDVGFYEINDNTKNTADTQEMRIRVKSMLDFVFATHFQICNLKEGDHNDKCSDLDSDFMYKLVNARDKTLYMIGQDKSNNGNRFMDKKLFDILIRLFLQCNLECDKIVEFFPWRLQTPLKEYENENEKDNLPEGKSYKPRNRLRLANMINMQEKEKETVEKILGNNELKLKKQLKAQTLVKTHQFQRRKQIKTWTAFWDDITFVKHLQFIGYYESQHSSFESDVMLKITNTNAFSTEVDGYFVGFPASQTSHGSIRLLEQKWVDEHLPDKFKTSLMEAKNQKKPIPKKTKQNLMNDMKKLTEHNVTHVHKYKCKTTLKTLYCNAISNPRGAGKGKYNYECMYGDQITEEWLFQTVVGLNGDLGWYQRITDPSVCNETFELPVASVIETDKKPVQDQDAPLITYPQEGEGTCGISAFSSAFAYNFDVQLAARLIQEKQNYLESLSQPVKNKSKKSSSMMFLTSLMFKKPFSKKFMVTNLHKIPWKSMISKSSLFYSIILCLPKSTNLSRDHIFAIVQGWIFDSNLSYGIALNLDNLNWSAGHGKNDVAFSGFHEVYQISLRKQKKKTK